MATSELYINLAVDNDGYIMVHDLSDYLGEDSIYEFSFYEAVFDVDMNLVDKKITNIAKIPVPYSKTEEYYDYPFSEWNKSFLLPEDGEYTYMKLLLPKKEHVTGTLNQYYIDGNAVYLGTNTCPGSKSIDANTLYEAAFQTNVVGFDESSIYASQIYSIAYLNQCLLKTEKQILEEYNCKQSGKCNSSNFELRYQRDILLDAHRVLLWLIATKDFDEATKILNRINSCGTLCNSSKFKRNGGCGCGKSL